MDNCPFCNISNKRPPVIYGEYVVSILDDYPVSRGHCLVIPKRHVESISDLKDDELKDLYVVLDQTKQLLKQRYNPDGFNIGVNEGRAAGQTVPHLHIHIIPRYNGDMEDPRGGVRGVIPEKQKY